MENREMKMFYDWGNCHEGEYKYIKEDKDSNSYFINREKDEYMMEYGFATIINFKTKLECLWLGEEAMEEIMKLVASTTIKNYKRNVMQKEKKDMLDEFIYIF